MSVGVTAAGLHGLEPLPPDDGMVHVLLRPGRERHQQPGVRVHTQLLAADDSSWPGLSVTSVARTVTDCVLTLRREDAVALLDALLRSHRLRLRGAPRSQGGGRGRRRVRRTWDWWDLAHPGGQSPLETSLRLIAMDACCHLTIFSTRCVIARDASWATATWRGTSPRAAS